jgi:hypothetical protein
VTLNFSRPLRLYLLRIQSPVRLGYKNTKHTLEMRTKKGEVMANGLLEDG